MSRTPELSRCSVSERSSTSAEAVFGTASRSSRFTDSALERSTSPLTDASTTLPSGSKRSSSSGDIARPPELSDHPYLGSFVSSRYHADRVHYGLHEAQSTSAVVSAWLSPAAVVANGDGNLAVQERRVHLHRSVPGTIRVLDRVRDRLVAGKDDLVAFIIVCLALAQPSSKSAAKRAKLQGLGWHRELQAPWGELDRLESQQGNVVLPAGTHCREEVVAEALEPIVSHAQALGKVGQAVIDRGVALLDQPVGVEKKRRARLEHVLGLGVSRRRPYPEGKRSPLLHIFGGPVGARLQRRQVAG